ncbi:MAG: GNAT family N-acetyltransferase [Oscillospiraceae bacterium]|nr:GNAT family N-acetyltransferase [Oscillospiraceae bacterium]
MIFLETERLRLRNVVPGDAGEMFDYRNNEICSRYQRGQTKDLPGIEQMICRRGEDTLSLQQPCLIGVALKATDGLIGEIVVMPNDETISLGYTFSYKHHRQGYAYEALSALILKLREMAPDWEFISFTHPENRASMGLLTKLGYRNLGYIPSMESQAFGKWVKESTIEEIARLQPEKGV